MPNLDSLPQWVNRGFCRTCVDVRLKGRHKTYLVRFYIFIWSFADDTKQLVTNLQCTTALQALGNNTLQTVWLSHITGNNTHQYQIKQKFPSSFWHKRLNSFTIPMYKFIKPLNIILQNSKKSELSILFWLKKKFICTSFFFSC